MSSVPVCASLVAVEESIESVMANDEAPVCGGITPNSLGVNGSETVGAGGLALDFRGARVFLGASVIGIAFEEDSGG